MFDSRNLIISNVLKEARLIPNCECTWVAGLFFSKVGRRQRAQGPDLTEGRGYGGEILSL